MSYLHSDIENLLHAYRHAKHAFEDFEKLRQLKDHSGKSHRLWHSLSHHLRHVSYRAGKAVRARKHHVRRVLEAK